MSNPLVSVIIPIYNVSQYLRQALDSLAAQKEKNLEFICVDDCSTDNCRDIIEEYVAKDSRFKKVFLKENSACARARKEGIAISKGEYIMFLDGDDYFQPDACISAYNAIKEKNVDVLMYGTNVEIDENVDEDIAPLERSLTPPDEIFRFDDSKGLIDFFYNNSEYSICVWSKIYNAEICKKVYGDMPNERVQLGEDAYAFFMIAYYCRSFAGVSELKIYNYCYGRGYYGNNANNRYTLNKLKNYCSLSKVNHLLYKFLEDKEDGNELKYYVDKNVYKYTCGAVYNWLTRVPISEKPKGYDLLCDVWGVNKVVAAMANTSWYNKSNAMQAVYGAEKLKRTPRKIRTVALYYHWLTTGGVERVISNLSYIWTGLGYKVIFITDTEPTDKDYSLAPGVERFIIPDFRDINGGNYEKRADALSRVLLENEVDFVDYNAWVSPIMEWDLLLIKSLGIAFNQHMHSIGSFDLQFGPALLDRLAAAKIMDSVTTLTRVDQLMVSCYNPNTAYIPNPVYYNHSGEFPRAKLDNHNIVWCGRISEEKNPDDAVEIFVKVKNEVPDAKLILVGNGDKENEEKLKKIISKYNLDDCVELTGYTDDVESYYLKSGVLLHTSSYEGFCMVFLEAGLLGLPIVAYSMEYLELVRNCPSMQTAPMKDKDGMADIIVNLFKNDDMRKQLGESTRREMLDYISTDVGEKWRELFERIGNGNSEGYAEDNTRILIETIFMFQKMGINSSASISNAQLAELTSWIRELEKARDYYVNHDKQMTAYTNDLLSQISELNTWVKTLEGAKDYFVEHEETLNNEITRRGDIIDELKGWIGTLEKTRDYFRGQMEAGELAIRNQEQKLDELAQRNKELAAELARRDTGRWAAGRLWAAVKNRLGLKGRK